MSRYVQNLRTIVQTQTAISLQAAIEMDDVNLVRLIVENDERVQDESLMYACKHGQTEIVRVLLCANDAFLYAFNNTFLCAIKYGHTEIVRLLLDLPLERCVNPSANDNYALQLACNNGQTKIVRLLLDLPLKRGVDPAAKNNLALQLACKFGHTEIVRLLIDFAVGTWS